MKAPKKPAWPMGGEFLRARHRYPEWEPFIPRIGLSDVNERATQAYVGDDSVVRYHPGDRQTLLLTCEHAEINYRRGSVHSVTRNEGSSMTTGGGISALWVSRWFLPRAYPFRLSQLTLVDLCVT